MSKRITKVLAMVTLLGSVAITEAQSTFTWNPSGPIYTAGRARNMIVDKNDASGNTLYVGSTSSGVFKSTDGGSTWNPIDDQGTVRNISYMAQDQAGNIWVATGEGFLRWGQKAKAQVGTGLYKLQSNALVKIADASVVGTVINRIACAPNDANRIALATDKGIMISTNGGQSFSAIAGLVPNSNSVQSVGMDVKFDNSGILYCSAGSELAYSLYNAVDSKVYKSDAGLTMLTNITPTASVLPDFKYGRIELAIAPSNNNVIYASCASKATANPTTNIQGSAASAVLKAMFVSYDAGTTWALLIQGSSQLDPLSNGGTIASGDYAHVLLVNPSNPDQLFIGGYTFYIFTRYNGSNTNPLGTWTQIGSPFALSSPYYLHENIHDIKIVPGSPTRFYFVTDAGIYRSTDMNTISQTLPPSFQPFYKGLVTGQFNSVSIERYPVGVNTGTNGVKGNSVTPYSGFIGGTGGNGLTYYSGTYSLVTQETNYLGGEVYNAELSRILDGAAIMSVGNGGLYRSTNVKSSSPTLYNINKYTGATISKVAPSSQGFQNIGFSTGTPFKLWENYGQITNSPDYAIFYNDSAQVACEPIVGIPTLTTQTSFAFSARRPNKAALIDSIVIRTGTIVLPTTQFANSPAFSGNDLKDITIKLSNNYVVSSTSSITIPPVVNVTGPINTNSTPGVTLNASTQMDDIKVTFASAPFATKTTPYYPTSAASASVAVVQDAAAYYRVFATVFYKYKAGDEVSVIDNNISTKSFTYTTKLSQPIRWTRTYSNVNTNPSGPKNGVNPPSVVNPLTNPVERIPTKVSARLAMIMNNADITNNSKNPSSPYAIVVSKAPLNLNDPLNFVRVSQDGCRTDDASGNATTNTISIAGKPIILEWSKAGTEIYYATDDNKLYRVSHITDIMDLSPASYNGKLYTDVFTYTAPISSGTINPVSPYRTTLIGSFTKPITSISISKDDQNLVLTFNDPASTNGIVMTNTLNPKTANLNNIGWTKKDNGLSGLNTYCSLIEKNDPRRVFVGTDNGLFYTSDISVASPTWKNVNDDSPVGGKLPNVQVFDLKQQLLESNDCYNAGQIYVATNGRGIWTTSKYLIPYYVDVTSQNMKPLSENALSIYPNPSNGQVNVSFIGMQGETASVQVMDISGRIVMSQNLGNIDSGEVNHSFSTSELNTGIYMVNVHSTSGVKRVAKLIVTK